MTSFFRMGGYGFFVWGSYGALALAILVELAALKRRRRQALAQAARASHEDD